MSDKQNLIPAVDRSAVQAVVIAAAVAGNAECLTRLPSLLAGFDEPYRTVATEIVSRIQRAEFVDWNVLGAVLEGVSLVHPANSGKALPVTAAQALNLIRGVTYRPDQVAPYLQLLQDHLQEKRQQEFEQRLLSATSKFAEAPEQTTRHLEELLAGAKRGDFGPVDLPPSELRELIPFMQQLENEQRGTEFLGLDSGFPELNRICNGLDTGLFIVAAPPGEGKTTLLWQIACLVAAINGVPVIFISLEQSKKELRAKVLARLARIQYRHLLRGRLQARDEPQWTQVLNAAEQYARFAKHLHIVEGDEHTTVQRIREIATQIMKQAAASRCLIVIDYLQKIPLSESDSGRVPSAKDRIDLQTSALRRIARDLDSPVVCISSENRQGYDSTKLDVFKESGEIEYSADIAAIMTRDTDETPPPDSGWRPINFNVVKNRNGAPGRVKLKFYASQARFEENGAGELPDDGASAGR